MSAENSRTINKDSLDYYLNELSKIYKKLAGRKMPVEIILIGGAAIIENYGFRDMTTDIDAIFDSSSALKEAINIVGDKYDLPNGWLNSDFKSTSSYSPKLYLYSEPYKTFSQIFEIRTISSEYLIAMKLKSGREYKNDLSDIIGILNEHKKRGSPISFEQIETAVSDLYGGFGELKTQSVEFIKKAFETEDFEKLYSIVRENEKAAKSALIEFESDYPEALNAETVDEVLKKLKAKQTGQNK